MSLKLNNFWPRVKLAAVPILYRHPPTQLSPDRLYIYLDALWRTRNVPGAILEVGCFLGGTAAMAAAFLRNTDQSRQYIANDTFCGFVGDHVTRDINHGTRKTARKSFSRNSIALTRKILDRFGAQEVQLLKGDIASLPAAQLPQTIAVCLVDVDLEIPVGVALEKVYPLVAPGGIILVDDVVSDSFFGAGIAYHNFCQNRSIKPEIFTTIGLIRK